MKYRQEHVLSGKGSEPHQFTAALRGITVDAQDQIFAVGDSEVKVFDSKGALNRRWSTSQPGFSIAVEGEIVYTGQEGQLEIYDNSGKLLDSWRDPERLGLVTAIGLLSDHVLIADTRDRCIRRYDKKGTFLNNIGKENRRHGFLIPNGAVDFAVDDQGIIHAANPGKHRVERYTPEGDLLGHFGRFDGRDPKGFPGCCNPTNVTVTDGGLVYVTEKAGPRAKVYDAEGKLLAVIATDVFDLNCKNMDVAVDSRGRVYVVDTVRLQIHSFVPEKQLPSSQSAVEMEGVRR
jgi:sugar lactone lactonase YvrE